MVSLWLVSSAPEQRMIMNSRCGGMHGIGSIAGTWMMAAQSWHQKTASQPLSKQ